jgi:(2Fe-2S) ferredoxin
MAGIPQPAFYLFFCSVERPAGFPRGSCIKPETRDLFNYMANKLMEKGIIATVQPVQSSCMNRCSLGPVMLVEPSHTLYVGLDKAKIDRIIEEHIINGNVVSDFVVPEAFWDKAVSVEEILKMSGNR